MTIKTKFKKFLTKNLSKYKLNYKDKGFINFIDIGSTGGLPLPWKNNANLISYLLNFEPNEELKSGKDFYTFNMAVWEKDDVLPFYIYGNKKFTGSSLFQQNYEYVQENYSTLKKKGPKELSKTWFERSKLVETKNINCTTIDKLVNDKFKDTVFHFMKIDAQGAEYNILKGAEELLKNSLIGLHLELFVIPLYKGIVLFDDVVEYLKKFNFRLIKKFPAHGTFNSQHDCLFIKEKRISKVIESIRKIYNI